MNTYLVIVFCPYCGRELQQPITYGLTSCTNCNRIFDSSKFNRLLSIAWQIRRQDVTCPEFLVNHYDVDPAEAEFVFQYVSDECYSHEDFMRVLEENKVSKNWC